MLGAALALCVASPASADARVQPAAGGQVPLFGYNVGWKDNALGYLDAAKDSGANVVRMALPWDQVELERARYRWGVYDWIYAWTLANGLRPIFMLHAAPCWARLATPCDRESDGRPRSWAPRPKEDAAWAEFVRRAAARYPEAAAFQVWNEPNLPSFWAPEPQPSRYVALLHTAYDAVKGVNPALPVLVAGMAPMSDRDRSYMRFLRVAWRRGAGRWSDGVAVHPYPDFERPPRTYARQVHAHLVRVSRIAPRTPKWVTEIGVPEGAPSFGLTEQQQARLTVRVYRAMRRVPRLRAVVFYRLTDDPAGAIHWDPGAGVLSADGQKKPVFHALSIAREVEAARSGRR